MKFPIVFDENPYAFHMQEELRGKTGGELLATAYRLRKLGEWYAEYKNRSRRRRRRSKR